MATKGKGRTKAEINNSYDDVATTHGKNDLTEKEAAQKAAREAQLRQMVSNLSPEKTLQKVVAAQMEATKTFSNAQEALSSIVEEVRITHEALELKRAELEELHGKDVIASATDVLIEEHEKKKQQLEQEAADLRVKFAKERQELQASDQEFKAQLNKQRVQEQQEILNLKLPSTGTRKTPRSGAREKLVVHTRPAGSNQSVVLLETGCI